MIFNMTSFAVGFASGFGTGFFTRELTKITTVALRPVTKAMIRSSMLAVEKGREALAVAGETFEDLVAEARSDLSVAGTTASSAKGSDKSHGDHKAKASGGAKKGHA